MTRLASIERLLTVGLGFVLPMLGLACGGSSDGGTAGSTTGSSTTTHGTGGTTASTGSTGGTGAGGADGGAGTDFYAILIRGTFASSDITQDQTKHDQLATSAESQAKMLGDTGHIPMLGIPVLGTTMNQFMDIDTWSNTQGPDMFYANPQFQTQFGALFSSAPDVEEFDHQPTWYQWGGLGVRSTYDPYYFVIIRGTLADPSKAQAAHDQIAMGAQSMFQGAGDVGHVVFTGRTDPTQFLAVDIWKAQDNIQATYSNAQFQAAFATFFSGAPALGVYQSTSWVEW